jgi:CBS domain-containing protein
MSDTKFRGFICYAQKNGTIHNAFMDRLQVKIRSENAEIELFSDVDIQTSQKWDDRIKDALDKSDFFVILASNDLYASDYVKSEEFPRILKQHSEGKVIMPVKISATSHGKNVFSELSNIQFFRPDFFEKEDTFGKWLAKASEDTNWQDEYMNQFYTHLINALVNYKNKSKNKGALANENLFEKISDFPHISSAMEKNDNRREFRFCKPTEKMIYAANRMRKFPPVRHLAVINDEDSMLLKGIISRRDVARQEINSHYVKKDNTSQLAQDTKLMLVDKVMTSHNPPIKEVFYLTEDSPIKDAVRLFATRPNGHAIGGLPVIYQGSVLEMLSYSDILEFWETILTKQQVEELNSITANDFGTKTGIVSLSPEDDLGTAYFLINGQPPRRALPVIDTTHNLKGMISDLMVLENYNPINEVKSVKEFMRVKDLGLKQYFNPTTTFGEIIKMLRAEKDLTSLPVVKEDKLFGIISYADVLKKILKVLDPDTEDFKA